MIHKPRMPPATVLLCWTEVTPADNSVPASAIACVNRVSAVLALCKAAWLLCFDAQVNVNVQC